MFISSYILDCPSGKKGGLLVKQLLDTIYETYDLPYSTHVCLSAYNKQEAERYRTGLISTAADVETEQVYQPGRGISYINYSPDTLCVSNNITATIGECTPKALYVFSKKMLIHPYLSRNHAAELKDKVASNIVGTGIMSTIGSSKSPYLHIVCKSQELYIVLLRYKEVTVLLLSDIVLDIPSDYNLLVYNIPVVYNNFSLLINGIYFLSKFRMWSKEFGSNDLRLFSRVENYLTKIIEQGKL